MAQTKTKAQSLRREAARAIRHKTKTRMPLMIMATDTDDARRQAKKCIEAGMQPTSFFVMLGEHVVGYQKQQIIEVETKLRDEPV